MGFYDNLNFCDIEINRWMDKAEGRNLWHNKIRYFSQSHFFFALKVISHRGGGFSGNRRVMMSSLSIWDCLFIFHSRSFYILGECTTVKSGTNEKKSLFFLKWKEMSDGRWEGWASTMPWPQIHYKGAKFQAVSWSGNSLL